MTLDLRVVISLAGRTLSAAAFLVVGVASFSAHSDAAATDPVTLRVTGSSLMESQAYAWQNDLVVQNALYRMDYSPLSAASGRTALLERTSEIALSPTPFSDKEQESIDELATLGEKPVFVTVPVGASALAFSELRPLQAIHKVLGETRNIDVPVGPIGWSSEQLMRWIYQTPANVSDPDYAKGHGYQAFDPLNPSGGFVLSDPADPTSLEPQPGPDDYVSAGEKPNNLIIRVGPTEDNLMMERVLRDLQPALWAKYAPTVGRTKADESGITKTFENTGASANARQAFDDAFRKWLPTDSGNRSGLIAGFSRALIKEYELKPLENLKLQDTPENRANWALKLLEVDGIAPTNANISKVVDTSDGLTTPDAALSTVTGGYPFSYVNKMIVRVDKMSIAKGNAAASLVRFVSHDGQKFAEKSGDVPLSEFHQLKAYKGANEIVKAVCPLAERIRSTGKVILNREEVSIDECGPKLPTVTTTTSTTSTSTTTTTTTTIAATTTTATTVESAVLQQTASPILRPTSSTKALVTTTTSTSQPPTTTTAKPKPTSTLAKVTAPPTTAAVEPDPILVRPVKRPGRRKSVAIPMVLSAGCFGLFYRIGTRKIDAGI